MSRVQPSCLRKRRKSRKAAWSTALLEWRQSAGRGEVAAAALRFDTAEMTIRRDLDALWVTVHDLGDAEVERAMRAAASRTALVADGSKLARLATAVACGTAEVDVGQWESSYLRGHLGLSASGAGLAAFGYWGALTAVRIGLALPAGPVPVRHVIGWGMAASVGAAALIWWQPSTVVVVAGFVILGAALAVTSGDARMVMHFLWPGILWLRA
jgi:hypothetical protein